MIDGSSETAATGTAVGIHAWLVLWKATKALETWAERSIHSLGMCISDFAVLEALLHKGPLPVNTLGKKVLLTSGSMTAAVDRLERRGLVERRDSPNDRRTRIVHLTPEGRKTIRKLFATHKHDMDRAFASLAAEEIDTLVSAIRRLGLAAEALIEEEKGR